MPALWLIAVLFISSISAIAPTGAAEVPARACLSKAEQRAAVASNRAIPLSDAIKYAQDRRRKREVLRAQLCRRGDRLVYVLTLLARNGKVVRVTVDAVNGGLITGR